MAKRNTVKQNDKKLAINTTKNTAITKQNDVKSLTKEDVQRLCKRQNSNKCCSK
jgi:histone H3/H4